MSLMQLSHVWGMLILSVQTSRFTENRDQVILHVQP